MLQSDQRFPAGQAGSVSPRIPDHELLQPIGGGSYGTVWLARNSVGTFRAVKMVERGRFEDERPYAREYEGLQLFEPVSRSHEGLVDILHLGRDEEEGYFYYIMEAADDVSTGQQIDPANYTPRTLEHDLKERGRLPVAECIEISAALADSLAFLHKNKLVHRDLKPSNILFIQGTPKVADIGLVARAGAATFVGSEGFVAPEGPGKPQADVYSLGKVIYEMAMGKDRQAFPSPPTALAEWPERKEIIELNEIISKACDPDLRRRYQSAEELAADLKLLQQGGKPSRLRRRREFISRLARTAAVVLLLLAFVGVGSLLRPTRPKWQLRLRSTLSIPGVQTWFYAQIGHLDDDGIPDIFVTSSNKLHICSVSGGVPHELKLPPSIRGQLGVELVHNFYQNGQDGVFLSWRDNRTNLNLALLKNGISDPKVFARTGGLAPDGEHGSSMLESPAIIDFNQDGRREMIAVLTTSYGTGPRGICCFDFDNSRFLWEFQTAPYVRFLQFAHLTNGTGPLEIIFGSNSPNNGKTAEDGTDDGHCYLYALSAEGEDGKPRLLWRKQVGNEYSVCRPLLIHSDPGKAKEIIAAVWTGYGLTNDAGEILPQVGKLMRFDHLGNCIAQYDAGASLVSSLAADVIGGDAPEILATDRLGRLHILDAKLNLISVKELVPRRFTGEFDEARLELDAVEDFNRDGRKELIFHSSQVKWISGLSPKGGQKRILYDNCVIMFDTKLRQLAKLTIADRYDEDIGIKVVVAELSRNGRKGLVVLGNDARVLELVRK